MLTGGRSFKNGRALSEWMAAIVRRACMDTVQVKSRQIARIAKRGGELFTQINYSQSQGQALPRGRIGHFH